MVDRMTATWEILEWVCLMLGGWDYEKDVVWCGYVVVGYVLVGATL